MQTSPTPESEGVTPDSHAADVPPAVAAGSPPPPPPAEVQVGGATLIEPAPAGSAVPGDASTGAVQGAASAPAPAPRPRTKGVADIVFLVDVTGSMAPIIDALRKNIEVFVDSLSRGDANNAAPVKDWRGKVVGYRDIEHAAAEGLPWIEDHPFVRDAVALKAQLGTLRAQGGGDEPESLLDALYTIATMEATPKGAQSEDPARWRYRSEAARVVVVFTDASFKETLQIPAAKGGSLQDVANVVMANRIILSLFAPNFESYDRLSQIDKSEWEVVEYEGLSPQEALQRYTADAANFRTTLKQLAASVSKSAETIAL
ncbi:vWA domain-containing protein [Roseisolibacter sp. H3M3-2]|uniref:vWA domain-containing protein n=1 Tax=Roseisolibacter sp. H3M3-2 TaxID=3031323 RepID=UPI0023DA2A88|nr:vWA domain-containing protein [Roseisolibacter sp. H3M3-2]MDF1501712.1 VWA domain-containing protein [Roseisolibacter sp. H3M3-2]